MNEKQMTVAWVISISFIYLSIGLAQPGLEVTGIIRAEDPIAVVNGEIVKAGDVIEGVKVVEIGEEFVKFQDGHINFTKELELKEAETRPPLEKRASLPAIKTPCSAFLGKELSVRGFGVKDIFIAVDLQALQEMVKAMRVKDKEGIMELILLGRLFPITVGTNVRVLGCNDFEGKMKIRIIDDKDFTADTGWALTEMVIGTE